MNKYGYRILWAFAALAAAAAQACSAGNENPDAPDTRKAVEFSIGTDRSRAFETTTKSLNRIGVFGYSTTMSGWQPGGYDEADFFVNKMVVRKAAGSEFWWYDGPKKYWPDDDESMLTFFAYAPYVDVQDIFTLTPIADNPYGAPMIGYTPHADAIRQIDLLWDKQADLTLQSHGGAVEFEMKHALTSIAFEAMVKDDDEHVGAPFTVEVLGVGVGNAYASGIFDLDGGIWTLDKSQLESYTLTQQEHKGLNSVIFHCGYDPVETPGYTDPFAKFVTLSKSYATLMILPQEFRKSTEQEPSIPGTSVFIEYRTTNLLTGEKEEVKQEIELFEHETAGDVEWGVGAAITYQFTISLFDGVTVRANAESLFGLGEWENGGEDTVDVY